MVSGSCCKEKRRGGGRFAGGVFVCLAREEGGAGVGVGRLRFEKQTTVICLRGGLSNVFQLQ